jgi:hypothetical protein
MAKTVIVQLTDDMDGGEADETVSFALNGTHYEIDLSTKNADALRSAFAPFIEKARRAGRGESTSKTRSSVRSDVTKPKTLFSELDAEEKDRFRIWANMPTARRIGDEKIIEWTNIGRP